ncbi:protein ALP1-like [Brachypodium distachyon]|uniref:protein ALP1-like n=1 Tax=Brachypodium distachyon TaxID=15368 RepID=UPI000D0CF608|nr:protein ALP1-like [Brachypodium distachyon]|eukprot:XP_024312852.1 protein ALP1-like [Brachypodium distachyon]
MHVPVIVPVKDAVNHVGRAGYATQNVMGVCDFDMRFISVVAGWPGKFYLVDSGYPNYLAPFRGTRYHLPEYQHGTAASGRKEVFNYLHSSLKNVIERCFAVLKQRWRMLKVVPSYPPRKQARIIIACMALHNFIRDSNLYDYHFARCDADEHYMPPGHVVNTSGGSYVGSSNATMDATRDRIADALMAARE